MASLGQLMVWRRVLRRSGDGYSYTSRLVFRCFCLCLIGVNRTQLLMIGPPPHRPRLRAAGEPGAQPAGVACLRGAPPLSPWSSGRGSTNNDDDDTGETDDTDDGGDHFDIDGIAGNRATLGVSVVSLDRVNANCERITSLDLQSPDRNQTSH